MMFRSGFGLWVLKLSSKQVTRRGRSDPVPNCSNDAWKDWTENSTVSLGFIKLPILGIQIGILGMWKFPLLVFCLFCRCFLGIRYHGIITMKNYHLGAFFFNQRLQANLSSLMPSWKHTLKKRDQLSNPWRGDWRILEYKQMQQKSYMFDLWFFYKWHFASHFYKQKSSFLHMLDLWYLFHVSSWISPEKWR